MKKFSAFLSVFLLLCAGGNADSLLSEFDFAIFDRAGFASIADGQKPGGTLSDNFSNSAGLSLFVDSGYDDEDYSIRGEGIFSIFCAYDYLKVGGDSSSNLRYGFETSLLFMNTWVVQCYDFTNNEIDFLGGLGIKAGKWFNNNLGFEINAGIERGFISEKNYIRLNAGILVVPFGSSSSRKSIRKTGQPDHSEKDVEALDAAMKAEGTEKLEKFCISHESKGDRKLFRQAATEIASRRLKVQVSDLIFADNADLANPYAIEKGKVFYIDRFNLIAYTDEGILCSLPSSPDYRMRIVFLVRYTDELKKSKSLERGFFRPADAKSLTVEGTQRTVPVFDCAYCF